MRLAQAQVTLGDNAADPVKLFEGAQNAHARGDLVRALELYEEAIKVRPEFPEAEFQRGNVLISLERLSEAEVSLRRAIELRKDWSLPYSALGALLMRTNRDPDAVSLLQQALKLDHRDNVALRMLAELRLRAGDAKEALKLARSATKDDEAPASAWILQAMAERANGDRASARASLQHALQIEPKNIAALLERAELSIDDRNYDGAIGDLKIAEQIRITDKQVLARIAAAYERAGKPDEARRTAQSAGLTLTGKPSTVATTEVIGKPEEIEAANSEEAAKARQALESLLEKNPNNATLLARLGASYRTDDAPRSLEFYRRASEIQPNNPEYAVGYASALIQARRFAAAVIILRRVIAAVPNNYTAHANLATALYELKRYPEALPEYEWLLKIKPDLAVAYYFIATSHDYLGEYKEALASYEAFLERADVMTNRLEIEKVKLRLPSLRRQIQIGQSVRPKQ